MPGAVPLNFILNFEPRPVPVPAVRCTQEWRRVDGAARASNLLKVLISERGGSEKRKRRRRKGKGEKEEAVRAAAIKLA